MTLGPADEDQVVEKPGCSGKTEVGDIQDELLMHNSRGFDNQRQSMTDEEFQELLGPGMILLDLKGTTPPSKEQGSTRILYQQFTGKVFNPTHKCAFD